MAHALLTLHVSIPLSNYFSISHTWNRKIWTVVAIMVVLIVSLFEKKRHKTRYIWIVIRAIAITFVTSIIYAIIMFVFSPMVDF